MNIDSPEMRNAVCHAFAAALLAASPALSTFVGGQNGIFANALDSEDPAVYPSVSLIVRQFQLETFFGDGDTIDDSDPARELVSIGEFTGTIEMRAVGDSAPMRERLTQLITDLMLSSPQAPGVLLGVVPNVVVSGIQTGYNAPAAFEWDSGEWNDELVFANRRYEFSKVSVSFPALIYRDAVTIDHYILALTQNTTTQPAAAIPAADIEIRIV